MKDKRLALYKRFGEIPPASFLPFIPTEPIGLTDEEMEWARFWASPSENCAVTGNPVGTDTCAAGHPCKCGPCQRYIKAPR